MLSNIQTSMDTISAAKAFEEGKIQKKACIENTKSSAISKFELISLVQKLLIECVPFESQAYSLYADYLGKAKVCFRMNAMLLHERTACAPEPFQSALSEAS